MPRYLPIIGLEIHVRLKTASKIFCACPNVSEDMPVNTAICPICTGQPGALPSLNQEAIRLGVRAGLSLGCTIPDYSHFDRKNYFYPDLPKGYQISQFDFPVALSGGLTITLPSGTQPRETTNIHITRAHLEEDAAKTIHDHDGGSSLIDFNRAGTPLLEIVTEPDLRSPLEAKIFLQELQLLLRAISASDADMEKGYMRCDANVSLLPVDEEDRSLQKEYNPKVEVKNLNSFHAVERAIAYEIQRQTELLNSGELPIASTHGWNENAGKTFKQRIKETSSDYRYFPEPDLPPLVLVSFREEEKTRLPELPQAKRQRLMNEWGFGSEEAKFFVANEGWADFAEHVMSEWASNEQTTDETKRRCVKLAGGWLTTKFAGLLASKNLTISTSGVDPENFAEFLHLIETNVVNSANAQKLLALMVETHQDPSHLLEEHHLSQMQDTKEIEELIATLIRKNPDQVAQILAGKTQIIKWFVGIVMKTTEGRANPANAEKILKKQLGI